LAHTLGILHYAGPPGIGGVEVTIQHHARLLANNGHRVRIIAGSGTSADERVEVRLDPLFGSRGGEIEQVNRQLAAGDAGFAFQALVERTAAALEGALAGVDLVMIHNVLSLHKNMALTAALRQLHDRGRLPPILAWCHDFAWRDPLYLAEMHDGWPWNLLREPWPGVKYVVVSEDRRTILSELLGRDAETIEVVTPGVDLPAFLKLEPDTLALVEQQRLLEADPLLLLPARITRRKNIELAIPIVGALQQQGLAPLLVITGPPGPHNPTNAAYLAQLEALQCKSGAEGSILFLYRAYVDVQDQPRPVSDAMMADLYKLADGLLFPSTSEGFGIPIIEAALASLPIFCSAIAPFHASAGDAALYFGAADDPATIAARIAEALRADPRYHFRRRVRLQGTWEAIYRDKIVPLIEHAW
jgi:mannosylglucosylglycerate synthase